MRIALDATYSLGENLSGVGVYSRELLFGLASLYPEHRFEWRYRVHRLRAAFSEHLPHNCSRSLLQEPWFVPRRADLFHALNQRMPAARLRRSVVTFHDLFVFTESFSTPEFRTRFQKLARDAAAQSDLIIAVSRFTADQIVDVLKVDRARIRVVHHGVRSPRIGREREKQRQKNVLHVGAIQARKNIERLIEAFEHLPDDWRLTLAGARGYGADAIFDRIARSPARDRIVVTGYVAPVDLDRLYTTASIFAFPSAGEGFGIPVLEAMAAGLPVICSNQSSLPEVAGDAARFVCPHDAAELREALVELASNPPVRAQYIAKGYARAANFTWDKAVRETFAVYRELA